MATIKQKSTVVEIEGGKRIEVRRMRWKAAREFFKKLAAAVSGFYANTPAEQRPAFTEIVFSRLPALVADSDELITHLCTESAGLSLDEFDALDQALAFLVLDAALAVNFDEETKNCLAGIGGKIAAFMPAGKTTPSAISTPTS